VDSSRNDHTALAELLADSGFVAADEEADELLARAAGDRDLLVALVERRLTGEPLAWITGTVVFCGVIVHVDPGVYPPRWQTEPIARRAVERLPDGGTAVDVCTGAGAIAATLSANRPNARVVATDVDERAVACARRNGVDAHQGDLFEPLPPDLAARVDLVVGAVPYVPTAELSLLQRDTLTFESPLSYDGGPDGTDLLRADLDRFGYCDVAIVHDEDGDVRGIEATLAGSRRTAATID
jgi:release factor glutamine methyltransferase